MTSSIGPRTSNGMAARPSRRAVKDDDRRDNPAREREMDDLKSALDDLTAKVERLAAMQAEARKKNP